MANSGQQRKSLIQKSSSDPFKRKCRSCNSAPPDCFSARSCPSALPQWFTPMDSPMPMSSALLVKNGSARPSPVAPARCYGLPTASPDASAGLRPWLPVCAARPVRRPVPAACPVEVMMARSWSPTLFRKAFDIKGNDDLRWVSLAYALQVF